MRKGQKKGIIVFIIVVLLLSTGGYFNIIRGAAFPERKNVLIFGIDATDRDSAKRSRSDSIMLFSYGGDMPPSIISIPRDTRVEIPGRRSPDKINHAHAFGDKDLLIETVEKLFNIKINHYIRINYRAVVDLVDHLGGIHINVPIDMKYSDPYDKPPLHIDIKKGEQILDGKNALHFLRFRKGYANQDLGRIEAQQKFVKALKGKILSPTTIIKAPILLHSFYNNIDTNMPKREILRLGYYLSNNRSKEVESLTMPGRPSRVNGVAYYIVEDKDIKNIRENYLTTKQ